MDLLDRFQRGFPLLPRPFGEIARQLGRTEGWVLDTLGDLQASGAVSRVGAVFAPNVVGASTLAALCVPPGRLEDVAGRVSAHPAVTHNYARDHAWNLWFVATAVTANALDLALQEIATNADCGAVLDLRLEEEYHIDLGFRLRPGAEGTRNIVVRPPAAALDLGRCQRALVAALSEGLPRVCSPFAALGARVGMSEEEILGQLRTWVDQGVIRRFGIVVRHGELGFHANVMAVWTVPEGEIRNAGTALAREPGVTLCYRRRAAPPRWPHNLFCMVHGRSRASVREVLAGAAERSGVARYAGAILPTIARFKQRGATCWQPGETGHG